MDAEVNVADNPDLARYELRVGEDLAAILDYELINDIITFVHAETLPEFRHRGLAGELTRVAIEESIEQGRRFIPRCAFVVDYVRHHPEYQESVA